MGRDNGDNSSVAYFSMEIGLEEGIHTYSGGLGVLAGATIRSGADFQGSAGGQLPSPPGKTFCQQIVEAG